MTTTTPAPETERSARGRPPGPRLGVSRGPGHDHRRHARALRRQRAARLHQREPGCPQRHAPVRRGARHRGAGADARDPAGRHRPLGPRRPSRWWSSSSPTSRRATTASSSAPCSSPSASPSSPGLLNGFLVGRLLLNPIVATLGTNALHVRGGAGHLRRGAAAHDRPAGLHRRRGDRSGSRTPSSSPLVVLARHQRRRQAALRPAVASRRWAPTPRPRGRPDCGCAPSRARATSVPSCTTGSPASCSAGSWPSPPPSRATPTCCPAWRRSSSAAPRCSAGAATSSPPRSPRSSSASSSSSCSRSA